MTALPTTPCDCQTSWNIELSSWFVYSRGPSVNCTCCALAVKGNIEFTGHRFWSLPRQNWVWKLGSAAGSVRLVRDQAHLSNLLSPEHYHHCYRRTPQAWVPDRPPRRTTPPSFTADGHRTVCCQPPGLTAAVSLRTFLKAVARAPRDPAAFFAAKRDRLASPCHSFASIVVALRPPPYPPQHTPPVLRRALTPSALL